MTTLLLGAATLLPSLLLVTYFHQRDAYPEPPAVLWRTFGLGLVTVVPILLVVMPFEPLLDSLSNPLLYGFGAAFFGAAIPEELFKFLVLYYYSARHMEFDEPMDGVVYGATASLGFAALENVLYVSDGGWSVAILRAVMAVPGHAFTGAIMGYFVGQAMTRVGAERRQLLFRALTIPILLHGLYDIPLLASGRIDDPSSSATGCVILLLLPLSPLLVLGEAWWVVRMLRRLRAEQLAIGQPVAKWVGQGLKPAPAVPLGSALSPSPPPLSPPPLSPPPLSPPPLSPPPLLPPPLPPVEQPKPRAALSNRPPWVASGASAGSKRRPAGAGWGWLLTLGGGLLACTGGLLTLMMAIGLAVEEQSSEDWLYAIVGGFVIGVLPLVVGGVLFVWGIWRLNRVYRPVPASLSEGG